MQTNSVQNRPIISCVVVFKEMSLGQKLRCLQAKRRRRRRNGKVHAMTPKPPPYPRNTVFQQISLRLPSTRGCKSMPPVSRRLDIVHYASTLESWDEQTESFLTHLHDVEPECLSLCHGDGSSTSQWGFRAKRPRDKKSPRKVMNM